MEIKFKWKTFLLIRSNKAYKQLQKSYLAQPNSQTHINNQKKEKEKSPLYVNFKPIPIQKKTQILHRNNLTKIFKTYQKKLN